MLTMGEDEKKESVTQEPECEQRASPLEPRQVTESGAYAVWDVSKVS